MHRNEGTLFVTGATGFVGAALTIELLRVHPDDHAFCLVRAGDALGARRRAVRALTEAGDAYGVSRSEMAAILGRVTALSGDVTAPGLGLSPTDRAVIANRGALSVWHCAGSVRDGEDSLQELVLHNVTGTETLLETLLPHDVTCFNHVSTASVAGRKSGVISETLERPRGFNNRYEQSKHYGEMMVADHCGRAGVPYRILRPGVLVGHSQTGRATRHGGFLGWVLKLAQLDELAGGALRKRPLRYLAHAEATLNLVPIDSFVEDCIGIDAAGDATWNRVFHLTNSQPPTIAELCRAVAASLELAGIEITDDEADLDPLSLRFHRWTRCERAHTATSKSFSRVESSRLYPSPRHGACPLDRRTLAKMIERAVQDARRQQYLAAG